MEQLGLDAVWFVPARRSPFKAEGDSSPAETRLAMVARATEGAPDFDVSRVEVERPAPSYMVDTLRALTAREPGVRWTLLIGADQWRDFVAWKDPEGIADLARIAVMARDGVRPEDAGSHPDLPWVEVPVTRIDISSSSVRRRVAAGRSVRHMVPDTVHAFIESNGLYSSC